MTSKFKQMFAQASMGLALVASAGMAQAVIVAEDIDAPAQFLIKDGGNYIITGSFASTGSEASGYVYEAEAGTDDYRTTYTNDTFGSVAIIDENFTLTLKPAEVDAALELLEPGATYPVPAFEYRVSHPNSGEAADFGTFKLNLILPGDDSDTLRMLVAKNAGSNNLVIDVQNAHQTKTASNVILAVGFGALDLTTDCDTDVTVTLNGTALETGVSCTPTNPEVTSEFTEGVEISADLILAPGETARFEVTYPQSTPLDDQPYKLVALADTDLKNTQSGSIDNNSTSLFDMTYASSRSIDCDSDVSSSNCDEGFDGDDVKVSVRSENGIDGPMQFTFIAKDADEFDCSARVRVVTDSGAFLVPGGDTRCSKKRISFDISEKFISEKLISGNLAMGDYMVINTKDSTNSHQEYEIFMNQVDNTPSPNGEHIQTEKRYSSFDSANEKDSLAALIAFMSVLASIWYFRREKALKNVA